MEAKILTKSEEKNWDDFILNHPLATIHQTSKWGHFQEKIAARGKYWIVALFENGKISGGSMIIRHKLPKGFSWLYCARGPLLNYTSKNIQELLDAIIKALSPIAKNEKSIFMRIDPPIPKDPKGLKGPLGSKWEISHHGFQPEHTLILDLTKSEEEILAQMKPKGRYNIRLAQKKGVIIHKSKDVDSFYKILNQTTTRDKFFAHDKSFYEHMVNTLGENAALYLAEFDGKIIAGIIVTFYKDTAIYYYGASSNEHRETMAPYLLQWTAIKDAKEKGLKYYDFLGIAPENAANHPWAGVTEFKLKFGGTRLDYQPAQEYSFKKLHHFAYKALKKLR